VVPDFYYELTPGISGSAHRWRHWPSTWVANLRLARRAPGHRPGRRRCCTSGGLPALARADLGFSPLVLYEFLHTNLLSDVRYFTKLNFGIVFGDGTEAR
jgi:hypothetical protein